MTIIVPCFGTSYRKQYHGRIVSFNRNRYGMMIFLPLQCRMARAALGMGVRDLAIAAKVASDTVVRFERGDELKERTVDAIRQALESAGVEFTNGERPGVRLSAKIAAQFARVNASIPTKVERRPRARDTIKRKERP
jgi:DNA-binding XRE family transcriptional regulator